MKRITVLLVFAGIIAGSGQLWSQVTLVPTFVTQNDTVEVIFDATQGNGALVGVSQVYAHTGVITNLSSSPTDWRHVQGNWGTADPKVQMTNLGNNLHSIKYHINSFYSVPANETVTHLAFVFRDASGSNVGRSATGGDIFVPISQGGFQALLQQPASFGIYSATDSIEILAQASADADLALFLDNNLLIQQSDTAELGYRLQLSGLSPARYNIILRAVESGNFHYDTVPFVLRSGPNISFDTAGYEEGLTVLNDSTIALKLRAPFKDYVYVIGDFNQWQVRPDYEMFKSPDGKFFWQVITGLDANTEYGFQYYVGEEAIVIADPYSEKILDPWNDPFIPPSVYPNLKSYPTGKTTNRLGTFTINKTQYQWQNDQNYQRPAPEELVIYELLIRDFGQENAFAPNYTYKYVTERLAYLDSLGINAIQLMPVMEFENNFSWGYDPNFFFAPDKIYGTAEDLKILVDSAHGRGMAVILDIAMNHAFGSCPLVRLYFDPTAGQYGQPSAQNPWFNQVPKHDFNVGYDFDHTSDATQYFARRVFQHWIREYHVDGYRVDLSKGYTQKNSLGNVGLWGQYDQGRINILQRLKNDVNEVDSNAYMILEHFADNSEEIELSNRGFMLWGNENHQYNEATMGYTSNLSGIYYQNRSWNNPYLVGYMESHDEERLMYRNLQFGGSSGNYSARDLATALDRVELASAFFYTIPGPKMLWQFGERGYDLSINRCPDGTIDPNCRLAPKPSRWNYLTQQDRSDLYLQTANLINLRRSNPSVFQTSNVSADLYNIVKSIFLDGGDSNAVIIGNFGLTQNQVSETFPHAGLWYDFNSGDSMMVSGTFDSTFAPGEYHIWLDYKMARTFNNVSQKEWELAQAGFNLYPNPVTSSSLLTWNNELSGTLEVKVYAADGRLMAESIIADPENHEGGIRVQPIMEGLKTGVYLLKLNSGLHNVTMRVLVP